MTFVLIGGIAFAAAFVYCSFFEWTLHKYLMHSDRFMKYPHRAHQLEHHELFKADGTYYLNEEHGEEGTEHLTFAWWNAPLLFGIHLPAFAALYFWAGGLTAAIAALAAMVSYYALYEYLHYCMHVPANRWLERTRFFRFVQTHHRLHHVYYMKNLNVVVPIADFVLRTRVGMPEAGLFEKLEQVRRKRMERARAAEEEAQAADEAPLAAEPVVGAPRA